MIKTIAVANQKGGVGKTTTVVNLASCMAEKGARVLLVDLDAQGNATTGCGIRKKDLQKSSYDLLTDGNVNLSDLIIKTPYHNLWVIPSTMDLAGAEIELAETQGRAKRLAKALGDADATKNFDFVLIDCPPSLGLVTINALTAADTVLIPIQCEFFALEGLSQLTNTVKQVKKVYNPKLDIEGVLITMFDGRLNLTMQVVAQVKKYFGDKVYRAVIPRTVRLSEAPSFGMPINFYEPNGKGSEAYMELAREFLANNER